MTIAEYRSLDDLYMKGICYPSFDKLRTLARIFNVSIQTFSDVVDLEELERN